MNPVRIGLALAVALAVGGCAVGAPKRASDIQNLYAISDDISAMTMTQSDTSRAADPNIRTTLPKSYQLIGD
jgi:hypothetical protein